VRVTPVRRSAGSWVDHQFARPERQHQLRNVHRTSEPGGRLPRPSVLTSACYVASGALQFAKRTSDFGKLTCKTWEVHSTAFRQLSNRQLRV
jgi:hypothetical protein